MLAPRSRTAARRDRRGAPPPRPSRRRLGAAASAVRVVGANGVDRRGSPATAGQQGGARPAAPRSGPDAHLHPGAGVAAVVHAVVDEAGVPAQRDPAAGRAAGRPRSRPRPGGRRARRRRRRAARPARRRRRRSRARSTPAPAAPCGRASAAGSPGSPWPGSRWAARGRRRRGQVHAASQSKSLGHSTLNENVDLGEQRVEAGRGRRAAGRGHQARSGSARSRRASWCARRARGPARRARRGSRPPRRPLTRAAGRGGAAHSTATSADPLAAVDHARCCPSAWPAPGPAGGRAGCAAAAVCGSGRLVAVADLEVLDAVERCPASFTASSGAGRRRRRRSWRTTARARDPEARHLVRARAVHDVGDGDDERGVHRTTASTSTPWTAMTSDSSRCSAPATRNCAVAATSGPPGSKTRPAARCRSPAASPARPAR